MYDGFTHYEGNAVMWEVYHNNGLTHVYAPTAEEAAERFKAKNPNLIVSKVTRCK